MVKGAEDEDLVKEKYELRKELEELREEYEVRKIARRVSFVISLVCYGFVLITGLYYFL